MAYHALAYDAAQEEARRLAALVAASSVARLEVDATSELDALARALASNAADIVVVGLAAHSGEEIALVGRRLKGHVRAQVIYVGAREAFASEVYATPHVGFLLRPVSRRELDAALRRAARRLVAWHERPVVVRTPQGVERVIHPRQVSHVESSRRILRIHMGDEVIETYGKKSDLVDLFPEGFVQCHRSHLVNLSCVDAFGKYSLTLKSGEVVPVSRERLESTRAIWHGYLGRAL